jgi:1,4-dihydroxy-2-naphthoate octaprenyltransferase
MLSYGLALLSIAFVFAVVILLLLMWWSLFWFYLLSTVQYCKKVALQRKQNSHSGQVRVDELFV